jgi:hypothetical protein
MKKFMFVVIVLVFAVNIFSAAPSAAPEKKEIVAKASPTKVTVKISDPVTEKEKVSVKGDKTVQYTVTETVAGDVLDKSSGEKIGEVNVLKTKNVTQTNQAQGEVVIDFDDNNKPCETGVSGKKGDGEVIISLIYSPKERVDYSQNGIEIRERPEDLSNLKIGIGYQIGKHVSVGIESPLGTISRRVLIAGNSLGEIQIYDLSLSIKGYKDFYFLNLFVEAGLSYTNLSGGYSIGGIALETEGGGISPLIGFGTEINIERDLNIILGAVYEKRKIDTYLPGVPDPLSTGNEGLRLKVGMNYKFQL